MEPVPPAASGAGPAGLAWGEIDDLGRPLALLLHGFPDTPHTWRHLGPALAAAGFRVLAPFSRGYAPSPAPTDGCYHVAALVYDVLAAHRAHGGDDRAILIGHDWGAVTANALAASTENPFSSIVSMAAPPLPALMPRRGAWGTWLRPLPRQARLSWYAGFNQIPRVPERHLDRLAAHLWSRWSPGYDASEDLAHLTECFAVETSRTAAVGYYRALLRPGPIPERYRAFARALIGSPRVPLLYLHGARDGCVDPRWAARLPAILPPTSRVAVIENAGHFLQLERPGEVNSLIVEYLADRAG